VELNTFGEEYCLNLLSISMGSMVVMNMPQKVAFCPLFNLLIVDNSCYSYVAAGHELKGLMGYTHARVKALHLPLMALIGRFNLNSCGMESYCVDYQGYRLVAMSLLPVAGNQTLGLDEFFAPFFSRCLDLRLVYGSDNGGKDVYNSRQDVAGWMEEAAQSINLKGRVLNLTAFSLNLSHSPGHTCGMEDVHETFHAATDIEVHQGYVWNSY
jgi:hypothetical protein